MRYTPNPTRSALHLGDLPDGPLTGRQVAIADAVKGCTGLADFTAAPAEAVTTITVARIAHALPPAEANRAVVAGLNRARVELDRLERLYASYGAAAFSPAAEGVPTEAYQPEPAATRHEIVVNLLRYLSRTGYVLVRAGDRRVTRPPDGGYAVEAAP